MAPVPLFDVDMVGTVALERHMSQSSLLSAEGICVEAREHDFQ